jgi:hypothetical protein
MGVRLFPAVHGHIADSVRAACHLVAAVIWRTVGVLGARGKIIGDPLVLAHA